MSPQIRVPRHPRRAALTVACAAFALAVLAACTSSGSNGSTGGGTTSTDPIAQSGSSSSSAPAPAAEIAVTPATRATTVNPTAPVSVKVAHGTLTSVTMTNPFGKRVTGRMSGNASWHATEVLGYGRTYTVRAQAKNADGKATSATSKFTTLNPSATVGVSMDRMGDYALDGGETYGVAIVPVVHFDTAISNRKAAVKALSVTTSRPVDGAWAWTSDEDVAYRPQSYWPANTQVAVHAHVYGVNLGDHVYGASDADVHFTIGRKQTTIADDNAPRVDKIRVYNAAGRVLRTMNTSMGQHSGEEVAGQWINFYTLKGTYTVLEHDNPAIMDSQSYGLPASAPHGYGKLSVPYSSKISTDGIYLHEYNSTIYDQDNGLDVSEGCLNMRTADAKWFYNHSLIGDPVVVHGAHGAPEIAVDEGGDWSVPWAKWKTDNFNWN